MENNQNELESNRDKFLDDDKNIGDSKLNKESTYEEKNFEESDDFHKYDDTEHSNLDPNDPIAKSNEHTNENSLNERPTFNRTYDKNESEEVDSKDAGKFDGEIGI